MNIAIKSLVAGALLLGAGLGDAAQANAMPIGSATQNAVQALPFEKVGWHCPRGYWGIIPNCHRIFLRPAPWVRPWRAPFGGRPGGLRGGPRPRVFGPAP